MDRREELLRREEILTWFDGLAGRAEASHKSRVPGYRTLGGDDYYEYNREEVQAWATEAESALAVVFSAQSPVRLAWDRHVQAGRITAVFADLRAVFTAAHRLLKEDRLGSLIDAIRVESESELLEQADILAENDHLAAATVIAGGTLETHLRHLVNKNGLTISAPNGSISAYNQAVASERKRGNEIYSKADHDQVESWGKLRNDAAHDPGAFKRSKDQIKLMIEGVRQFIARVN